MFTGLIRHIGRLGGRRRRGIGVRLRVEAGPELLVRAEHGASIAVMGTCLTVVFRGESFFEADLSDETLSKTTLGGLTAGSELNLEPAMKFGESMDGHMVTGHVDAVGHLLERSADEGLWRFAIPCELAPMIASKGSVAVDGISLTVVDAGEVFFSVSVIPETVASTTLKKLVVGDKVNIEVDPIGRYVARFMALGRLGRKNEMLDNFVRDGWGK